MQRKFPVLIDFLVSIRLVYKRVFFSLNILIPLTSMNQMPTFYFTAIVHNRSAAAAVRDSLCTKMLEPLDWNRRLVCVHHVVKRECIYN